MSYQPHVDEENPGPAVVQHQDSKPMLGDISEHSIRMGFIKKVYGILCAQLLVTVVFTVIMMYSSSFVLWVSSNTWILYVDMVMIIVIEIAIICCKSVGRRAPLNYILLFIFTLGFSLLVGLCSAVSDPTIVFIAAAMTLGITIALTAYAIFTKTDFTVCGGMLFIVVMTLSLFGMFLWWGATSTTNVVYCSIWAIIYGIYLIYDTQLIVGRHRHKLEIDDYILGAMLIYIDIVGLFIELLSILGASK